jgi:hypothetical protein
MKVKVLKKFIDKHSGEIHKEGKILTVSKERFEEILSVDKLIEEIAENDTVEPSTVKKKTTKKAAKKTAE